MISLKTFQALTAALRCTAGDVRDVPQERRAHPRLRCQAEATVIFVGKLGPCPYSLRIQDISFGGIVITFSQPLAAGERFILLAGEADSGKRQAVLCSVTQSRRAGSDPIAAEHVIAASFIRELQPVPAADPKAIVERTDLPKLLNESDNDMFSRATFQPPNNGDDPG